MNDRHSPRVIALIDALIDGGPMQGYLSQCRVKAIHEDDNVSVPPTAEEVALLVDYLERHKASPTIVGSVGVLLQLRARDKKAEFRPTVDVDIWVKRVPPLLPGWRLDVESIGVTSWISPSGGHVDFLTAGDSLPSGEDVPKVITRDAQLGRGPFPVASMADLLKLKLNSWREKDFADAIALVKANGGLASLAMGKLNKVQRDNLDLVIKWLVATQQA